MDSKLTLLVQVYKPTSRFNECIKACVDQIDSNFNIVILKHGDFESEIFDEATKFVLKNFDANKIKVIYENINKGPAIGRNIITQHCDTDYFARVDWDDVIPTNFTKVINEKIAQGKNLILIPMNVKSTNDFNRRFEQKYNLPKYILNVSWAPYCYVIKTNEFIPYPDCVPEDVGSMIYYLNKHEPKSDWVVADEIHWEYYSTISNKDSINKNLNSWIKGVETASKYWASITGPLNRVTNYILLREKKRGFLKIKRRWENEWTKHFFKNGKNY